MPQTTREDVIRMLDQHTYELRRELLDLEAECAAVKAHAALIVAALAVREETTRAQATRIYELEEQVKTLSRPSRCRARRCPPSLFLELKTSGR